MQASMVGRSVLIVAVAVVLAGCSTGTDVAPTQQDLGSWAESLIAVQDEVNADLQQVAAETYGADVDFGEARVLAEATVSLIRGFGSVLDGSLGSLPGIADGTPLTSPYMSYMDAIREQATFSEESATDMDANFEEYAAAFERDRDSSRIEELFREFSRLDSAREAACFRLQQAMTAEGLPLLVCTVGEPE